MFGIKPKPKRTGPSTLSSKEMTELLEQTKTAFKRSASNPRISMPSIDPEEQTAPDKGASCPHLLPTTQDP